MIHEESIWITAGLLGVALLLRPGNPQVRFLFRLAVTIVTVIIWASMPGIGASVLFPLFVLPILLAMLPGATWKKWVVLYGVFHLASMLVLFGARITWDDVGLYSVVYTLIGIFYAGISWLFLNVARCLKQDMRKICDEV
ncbi:MAG: hypothetical protein QM758_30120 [Armatimonas sp.]